MYNMNDTFWSNGLVALIIIYFQVERHLSKIRTPTALVTLPAHGILVIGFDSGEIQTYDIGIYDLVHKV